jgi:hypothetical protein
MLHSVEMVTSVFSVLNQLLLGEVSKVNFAKLVKSAPDWSKDLKTALMKHTTQIKDNLHANIALKEDCAR